MIKPSDINVLIACEESQRVCTAFRDLGFNAYSCDLMPTSGKYPQYHIQGDVTHILKSGVWHIIIAHPPCTRLCNSGQRWLYYGSAEYRMKKAIEREQAIKFFMMFVNADCDRIAIENPMGIMSTIYRKPDCIYNPYDFEGETETKKTCLWLKGLPPLKPTQTIPKEQRTHGIWKAIFNGKQYAWNDKQVAILRSKTPIGVAKAMADQWGNYVLQELNNNG